MSDGKLAYTPSDLAIIIPTKDRPRKLQALLESIAGQNVLCGRVIVIGSGESVEGTVRQFEDRLTVAYYHSPVAGQIRQRNMGIAKLRQADKLAASLDDDLVLEPDAIEQMIALWNSVPKETAGIGFNIVNTPAHCYSRLMGLLLMDGPVPGEVLISGANVPCHNISTNLQAQWLGGGYTVWRREILVEYLQKTLDTRWAHGEDLRFSYPIGKRYPLYVCAGARVRHEHVYDQAPPAHVHRYRGRIMSLACFQFVEENSEFSRVACCWMILGSAFARLFTGLVGRNGKQIQTAIGQLKAVLIYGRSRVHRNDLSDALAD